MPAGGMGNQTIYQIDARGATDPAATEQSIRRALDEQGRAANIRILTATQGIFG